MGWGGNGSIVKRPPGCGQYPDSEASGAPKEGAGVQWTDPELFNCCKGGGYKGFLEGHHALIDAFNARTADYVCNVQGSYGEDHEGSVWLIRESFSCRGGNDEGNLACILVSLVKIKPTLLQV